MFNFIRSYRAKSNTRKQVNGWIKEIQKGIRSREKEIEYYERIAPLTPSTWDDKMLTVLKRELLSHKSKLDYYIALRERYENEGLI